jgi:tetratricopeptide (TPR) repeat protein
LCNFNPLWTVAPLAIVCALAVAGDTALETEARQLLDEGKATEAVRLIDERSPESGRGADVWFLLADGYHRLMDEAGLLKKRGMAKKMRHALVTALEIEPDHIDARRELADFYFYAPWIVGGSKDDAARQLDRLEDVAPGEAWATRGEHARNAGDLDAAREHFRRALDSGPRKPGVLFALGVVEQQLDHYEASLALLEELIDADPDHEKAYYYCARASAMAGLDVNRGIECATHYVDHCQECDDEDRGYGWWRRATLLKRKGDRDAALAAYREALHLNPELDGARKGLAELQR